MSERIFKKNGKIVVLINDQKEKVEDEVLEKKPRYGERLNFASNMMSQEDQASKMRKNESFYHSNAEPFV